LPLLLLVGCGPARPPGDEAPSDLPAAITLLGDAVGDQFGRDVAVLGDIDGDGNPEIAVTAYGAGNVYVFASRDIASGGTFHAADAAVQITTTGAPVGLADAGDVDGDGLHELAFRTAVSCGSEWCGQVSLFFGSTLAGRGAWTEAEADARIGWFDGGDAHDVEGAIVSPGDVDGDGLGDLWVGSRAEARIALARGVDLAPGGDVELGGAHAVTGAADAYQAAAGDVDGDGVDDLVVSDRRSRETWVVLATTFLLDPLVTREDVDSLILWEPGAGCSHGTCLQPTLGDIDGDGQDDLMIGDPLSFGEDTGYPADTAQMLDGTGRAFLFYGESLVLPIEQDADAAPAVVIGDDTIRFGRGVVWPPDLGDDGVGDLLVRSWDGAWILPGTRFVRGPAELHARDAPQQWSVEGIRGLTAGDIDGDGDVDPILSGFARPDDETGWVLVSPS
jgi:hypothetical protein